MPFYLVPAYDVLAIAFGTIDPIFRSPLPAWDPATWTFTQFSFVFRHLFGSGGFFGGKSCGGGCRWTPSR